MNIISLSFDLSIHNSIQSLTKHFKFSTVVHVCVVEQELPVAKILRHQYF